MQLPSDARIGYQFPCSLSYRRCDLSSVGSGTEPEPNALALLQEQYRLLTLSYFFPTPKLKKNCFKLTVGSELLVILPYVSFPALENIVNTVLERVHVSQSSLTLMMLLHIYNKHLQSLT